MQIPLDWVCVGVGDAEVGTDEGVEEAVDEAGAEVAGVVVDWVAVGEDCTALEDAAGVVDVAAWRGV
jgi:hypothetical protein